jgi:hypothetical protein
MLLLLGQDLTLILLYQSVTRPLVGDLDAIFSGLGPCFREARRYDESVLGLCKAFMAVISYRLSLPLPF